MSNGSLSKAHLIPSNALQLFNNNKIKQVSIDNLEQPLKEKTKFGDFWLTDFNYTSLHGTQTSTHQTHLVVVLSDHTIFSAGEFQAQVAVISDRTIYATTRDFLLAPDEVPMGSSIEMIEFWNSFCIPVKNLRKYLGCRLSRMRLDELKQRYLQDRNDEEYHFQIVCKYESIFIPENLPVGMIQFALGTSNEDNLDVGMIEFWEDEWSQTKYLREQESLLNIISNESESSQR